MESDGHTIPTKPVKQAALESDLPAAEPAGRGVRRRYSALDLALRLLLLATTASALATALSSTQTLLVSSPLLAQPIRFVAKFTDSPAIIYFVVAMAVACAHAAAAMGAQFALPLRRPASTRSLLVLALIDALLAAVTSSATGAAASIAYVGLKGNSHVGWNQVCGMFSKFCRHMGSAVALGLAASVILLALVLLSVVSLYRRGARP